MVTDVFGSPLPDYLSRVGRVRCTLWWVYRRVRDEVQPHYLLPTLQRVCDALRSSRAHIRLQFDRNCGMDSGVQNGDEHHWTGEWMDARVAGIETLQAKYPWLDFVDAGMYLKGFEAGVWFGIRSQAELSTHSESSQS